MAPHEIDYGKREELASTRRLALAKGKKAVPQEDVVTPVQMQIKDMFDDVDFDTESESEDEDAERGADKEMLESLPKVFLKRISDRRKKRNVEFSQWFGKKTKEIKSEIELSSDPWKDDEKMSARALSKHYTKTISEPREYQLELFEKAKLQNSIAVLDTGSGKTLISCLLIRSILAEEQESRAKGNTRRVSFFLVDSVTLVFQQFAVLNCNLDANIGSYYGDMVHDMWTKEEWTKILDEKDVLLMTADVLYNNLTHSFIKMEDINLLAFDEAHHCKKNHVYARIIRDFYEAAPLIKRPKIFGMTASPVDAQVDVVQAANELEQLLHSKIITVSDAKLLKGSVSRPNERVVQYPKNMQPFQTELYAILYSKYKGVKVFEKIFTFAKECASELGPWCADRVWKLALTEAQARKIERKAEKIKMRQINELGVQQLDREIAMIKEAQQIVENYNFYPLSPEATSKKLLNLLQVLRHAYAQSPKLKCIIFVKRRFTAHVLYAFLTQDEIAPPSEMDVDVLIGSRAAMPGEEHFTFRQQMLTVSRFRRGKLNCLIATSVAEEGLDIPDCNLVIRFDLYSTMIEYIQSRGRARHLESQYMHFIEANNPLHQKLLGEVRNHENIMRQFCQSLPRDRLIIDDRTLNLEEEKKYVFEEAETGAKLTMNSSMQLVSHFCGRLPIDEEAGIPVYIIRPGGLGHFTCELVFPENSPLSAWEGPRMSTKAGAKRAAAFEACVQLRKMKELDDHLMPKERVKDTPKNANARLALDIHKSNMYFSKRKPEFFRNLGLPPPEIYLMIFHLSNPDGMQGGRELQPIGLLTRSPMPEVPDFTVYGDRGGKSGVSVLLFNKPLVPTPEESNDLDHFTLRMYFDCFNKLFELDRARFAYWVVPIKERTYSTTDTSSDPRDLMDWDLIKIVQTAHEFDWRKMDHKQLIGRFLIDKGQRSRRFAVQDVVESLTPESQVPEGFSTHPGCEGIVEYSYTGGKKGNQGKQAGRRKWCKTWTEDNEPVLMAEKVLHRLNYCDPPHERDVEMRTQAVICPSAFNVSWIPTRLVYSVLILPAIITRLDSYMHAKDVCNLLDVQMNLGLCLEALTKDSDNTEEHGVEQQNRQKGMGNNYERLEFLGDCFLKMATTISLYAQKHGEDEFSMHVRRMEIICNQHLFDQAKTLKIPEYIQSHGFSRRLWYPDLKLLSGKAAGKDQEHRQWHRLGDKTIADVCEALIGAALLDGGLRKATKMVTALLLSDDHKQLDWDDYYKGYSIPEYQLAEPTAVQHKLAAEIEQEIGYKFRSPKLLMSAFTHASNPYSYEKVPHYQRLEFLGDAILDLACVRYIFAEYPDADPQWLTEHKMAMVSNKFLGAVSVSLGFHRRMRRVGAHLDSDIRKYEDEVIAAKEENPNAPNYWVEIQAPPKSLPDVLEAFIGAMFVDSEFSYDLIETFFDRFIKPYFVDMSIYDNFAGQHPTTFLSKMIGSWGCENWGYEHDQFKDNEDTYILTAVIIHDRIFSYGRGQSVKVAKLRASEMALDKMKGWTKETYEEECCKCEEERKKLAEIKEAQDEDAELSEGEGEYRGDDLATREAARVRLGVQDDILV